MKVFKLIVSVSENSIEILRYLSKNIKDINKMGVRIRIDKIGKNEFTEEVVNSLKKRNIVRLPALIAPEGKIFAGVKSITDLIERNLNNLRSARVSAPAPGVVNAELGSNPDLSNFWLREMYAGTAQTGKLIPRTDKEEAQDEGGDIERRMAEARRNIPVHRRPGSDRGEQDIDLAPRTRRRPPPAQQHDENYSNRLAGNTRDNIANDEDDAIAQPINPPRLEKTGNARDDDLDQRMLAAWLDNNHTD